MTVPNNKINKYVQDFDEAPEFLKEFDFAKLWFVAKKSILWILIIFLLAASGCVLYLRYTKSIYLATSTIKLEVKSSKGLLNLEIGDFDGGLDLNLQGEIELIKSEKIYSGVLDSLDLTISYFTVGEILDDERFQNAPFQVKGKLINPGLYNQKISVELLSESQFRLSYPSFSQVFNFGDVIKNQDLDIFIEKSPKFFTLSDPKDFYFIFNSEHQLINYIKNNLVVNVINISASTISISFKDYNRNKAIEILKAVNANYLDKSKEQKNKTYEQSLHYLEDQIKLTRDTLEYYEDIVGKLTPKSSIKKSLSDDRNVFSEVQELKKEKKLIQEQLSNLETLQDLILADSSLEFIAYAASVVGKAPLESEIEDMIEIEKKLKRLEKSYEVSTKKDYLTELFGQAKSKLLKRIQFNALQLQNKLNLVQLDIRKTELSLYQNTEEEEVSSEFKKLNRYYTMYDNMYQLILGKRIEIGIAKAGTVPNFQVLSRPSSPSIPISPIPSNIYVIGVSLAFTLSLMFVIIRYFFQNKINNVKELSKILHVPILGIVPEYQKETLKYSQLVIHKNPKSAISEAMRSIRTNLDFVNAASSSEGSKLLSITSTISGEGKTFVTINLAGIIALSDSKVVVIDLDLRKPKVHLGFSADNTSGVSSILAGKKSINECLQDSEIENLKFLTAGPSPPNPSEMLMSENFQNFIKELKEQFDVVVLDTPPVGLVTDGMIVMQYVDNPIYVMRAEYSKLAFASNLNKVVVNNKFKNLTAILNAVNNNNTYGYGNYYGYGYNYGYGYGGAYGASYGYYEDEDQTPKRSWIKRLFKRN